ncbi:hypothetical protein [Asticcacaulis machinosus]|uniref:Uncharacterized protein n=1 Tax=Asticcacaulis machinosus TaxID=2984211 RepID=A0ABT5HFN0_9CAUL|nr:hypothetical protein [Asticcacaulis machinosus]MDC7674906.1 hypothetical protein [Asticcacaulis machinosus]
MTTYSHRFFDKNTGEEIYASDDFRFTAIPAINHRISDPEFRDRYGGPAVVNRIEIGDSNADDVELFVYVDGAEEILNTGDQEDSYRRS